MGDESRDWRGTDDRVAREILTQGQLFLDAQFKSAIASDQRGMTFAAMLVAFSAAAIATAAALWDKIEKDALIGICALAGTLILAAGAAAWAARPIDFWSPGMRPEQWYDIRTSDYVEVLGGAVEYYQYCIDENEAFMESNQDCIRAALALAVLSPMIGAFVWWFI